MLSFVILFVLAVVAASKTKSDSELEKSSVEKFRMIDLNVFEIQLLREHMSFYHFSPNLQS